MLAINNMSKVKTFEKVFKKSQVFKSQTSGSEFIGVVNPIGIAFSHQVNV